MDIAFSISLRHYPAQWNFRLVMLLSWLGTDRFGGKSQRRDATADRFAS